MKKVFSFQDKNGYIKRPYWKAISTLQENLMFSPIASIENLKKWNKIRGRFKLDDSEFTKIINVCTEMNIPHTVINRREKAGKEGDTILVVISHDDYKFHILMNLRCSNDNIYDVEQTSLF